MLEVEAALELVLEQAAPLPACRVALGQALGLTLAENVASDINSPPHDKSLVDGYAVRAADLTSGQADLRVLEEVTAGELPTLPLESGAATRIMTGAPIPAGAEGVVMVEETAPLEFSGGAAGVRIAAARFSPGQNIMRRGASLKRGEQVLPAGRKLRSVEIGLLAEVGRAVVLAHPRPEVAVLATGNELVPASEVPGAGQIRNSNGPMLAALVAEVGATPHELGIARDSEQELAPLITRGLQANVLLLSGGVSAGVLDLVPGALAKLGVRQVFHKVNLKPGKPLWFGVLGTPPAARLVFGLPGNPVSTLVCFELFVRPALDRLSGRLERRDRKRLARLAAPFTHRGDRPTYFPARLFLENAAGAEPLTTENSLPRAELLDWRGSADLRTLTDADCLVCFPSGERQYAAGDTVFVHV